MKALVLQKEGLFYTEELPKPCPAAGEALIKVTYAGVCNTDLEMTRGYKGGFRGVLGHEFVGVVAECAEQSYIGRRVVGEINIGCGKCSLCLGGCANHCRERTVPGIVGKDGVFAEYFTLPTKNLHFVPDNVVDLTAVFAEPLAVALEILQQVHIRPTDCVAVVGDGKLGQLIAQVLSLTGCNLTVFGKHPEKLSRLTGRAKTVLSAGYTAEPIFDAVVECTGSSDGFAFSSRLVKPRGRLLLKSTFAGQQAVIGSEWVVNEMTLTGSRCGPFDAALRLMQRRLVEVEPLIDGIYSLAEWRAVFPEYRGMKAIFQL